MGPQSLIKSLAALSLMLIVAIVWRLARTPTAPISPAIPSASLSEPATDSGPTPHRVTGIASRADWFEILRQAEVPPRVLAKLVREEFDDRWRKRHSEAQARYRRGELDADDLFALDVAHDMEQEKAVRTAMGEEDFRKLDMPAALAELNLFEVELTAAETDALYDLTKNHRRQINELTLAKLRGEIDQATLDQEQARTQTQVDVQLKTLLGEKRFATVRGIDERSETAQSSSHPLNSPVSLEALVDIQTGWNISRHEMSTRLQQIKSHASDLESELKRMDEMHEQESQRILGTNVLAALEKGSDSRYQEMKRYATAWELDESAMDYIYRLNRYFDKAVADYQRQARALEAQGREVNWDGVNANVQEFARQTEQTLRNYLGEERFNRIKNNQIFPFAPVNQ
jgi:hypothetical protein